MPDHSAPKLLQVQQPTDFSPCCFLSSSRRVSGHCPHSFLSISKQTWHHLSSRPDSQAPSGSLYSARYLFWILHSCSGQLCLLASSFRSPMARWVILSSWEPSLPSQLCQLSTQLFQPSLTISELSSRPSQPWASSPPPISPTASSIWASSPSVHTSSTYSKMAWYRIQQLTPISIQYINIIYYSKPFEVRRL